MTDEADLTAIRDAVAGLCAGFPGEYWRALDRERAYPTAFVEALTREGFLGALIPETYGGSGLGLQAACAILQEIHRSGCNAAAAHAQMYTMGALLKHGGEEQKARWLPGIAKGEIRLQAFGVTEPGSGSDTLALSTNAVRDGDDYIVSGQKIWISRAEHSDYMLLLARTTPKDQVKKKGEGLSLFMVDMNAARAAGTLTVRPIRTMMNHGTTELFLDGVRVPAANRVGEEGQGFRYVLDGMNAERALIAAECLGDAEWFIDKARRYVSDREVFGRPLGANQSIQFPIARAYAQFRAAELMVREAAQGFDQKQPFAEQANIAKMLASEASWAAAEACVQAHGGAAFAEDFDIERKFRETRLYQVAPVSTNLILAYLGQNVLGMPRSY